MKAAAFAVLVVIAAILPAAAKSRATFRVHLEASASNGPAFSTTLQLFGRAVTIEKVPTISENDVTAVRIYRSADGTRGALFELNEHGRLTLDSLSLERRGGRLFVFVNGRAVSELQIDRRVSDGKIYVAAGLTENDAELLKKAWPARN